MRKPVKEIEKELDEVTNTLSHYSLATEPSFSDLNNVLSTFLALLSSPPYSLPLYFTIGDKKLALRSEGGEDGLLHQMACYLIEHKALLEETGSQLPALVYLTAGISNFPSKAMKPVPKKVNIDSALPDHVQFMIFQWLNLTADFKNLALVDRKRAAMMRDTVFWKMNVMEMWGRLPFVVTDREGVPDVDLRLFYFRCQTDRILRPYLDFFSPPSKLIYQMMDYVMQETEGLGASPKELAAAATRLEIVNCYPVQKLPKSCSYAGVTYSFLGDEGIQTQIAQYLLRNQAILNNIDYQLGAIIYELAGVEVPENAPIQILPFQLGSALRPYFVEEKLVDEAIQLSTSSLALMPAPRDTGSEPVLHSEEETPGKRAAG